MRLLRWSAGLWAGVLLAHAAPESVAVAAAANLTHVVGTLDAAFEARRPGAVVTVALGPSGGLVAQITNGAPFDVFLSADMDYPRALVRVGRADPATLEPFAVGRLVLWTTKAGLDLSDIARAVGGSQVHALAIANPETAPYGRAARQALGRLGLWEAAQPKLVTAGDISQAAQFVETGNADAGFVALSAVLSKALQGRGTWTEVAPGLYTPLVQGAILTSHGAGNAAAAAYLAFLRGPEAGKILAGAGYGAPSP